MAADTESARRRAIGARIRQTREALGYPTRPAFLRDMLSQQDVDRERDQLEKYEDGRNEPSTMFLGRLREWQGITADWILFGDPSALPQGVYAKIVQRRAG